MSPRLLAGRGVRPGRGTTEAGLGTENREDTTRGCVTHEGD